MIDPEDRLWAGTGNCLNGGPYTWHVSDFDQRRTFAVTYAPPRAADDVEGTEDICITKLRRHIDNLAPDVVAMRFSDLDGPITTSTGGQDDVTTYVNCHPVSALKLPLSIKTISVEALTELDRLAPQVDLVTYPGDPTVGGTANQKVVFKYWFLHHGMFRRWYELQCWSRLPRDHPHIVPFDAVVIENAKGGIVGFTSLYVTGGTLLDKNATARPFRLQWLRQLLCVVDDLNHRYGIMHQDVAPRNLLIDENDNLCIFDFNYSIMIDKHYTPERDDIKGVIFTLYEIITLDEHFRDLPHEEQDVEAVLRLDWTKHPGVRLDHGVHRFRDVLDEWIAERRTREFRVVDTCVQWPWMPPEPLVPVPVFGPKGEITGTDMQSVPVVFRKELVQRGEKYWDWERPASYRLQDALARKSAAEAGGKGE